MIDSQLPLIDLHRHLDGSLRLTTILDLGRQFNLPLPAYDLEGLRPFVQVTTPQPGVLAFLERFQWMTGVLVSLDACARIAREAVEDLKSEGIDYAELRFSPWFMAEPHHLNPTGVVEAVLDGVQAGARETGVPVKVIGILSRTYGPEIAHKELEALLSQRSRITALDLAGDEAHFPGDLFVPHFRTARDAGWQITVHAGEVAGAHSIRQAVNDLGAQRIGHAVHLYEDPTLVEILHTRGIGIEANLTSNVQTSTVESYLLHPLKHFLDDGLLATLNSDDPGISAITLPYEYTIAAVAAGLNQAQIRQAQQNALDTAFLTPAERTDLLTRKQTP